MLIENQKIKMKWNNHTRDHYEELGYIFTKVGDFFYVSPNDLTDGSHAVVKVRCDYCGKIIDVIWKDYKKFKGEDYACRFCKQKRTANKTLEQRQDHLYRMALKTCEKEGYKLITPKNQIKTATSCVQYECPIHGVHETKVYTLGLGHGCIECGYELSKESSELSTEEVNNRINKCGGTWINKGEYTGWRDKNLLITCPICSKPFITSLNSFTAHGVQLCPECSQTKSNGEEYIEKYLVLRNIEYVREYRFDNCRDKYTLPFDFYLPGLNTVIEFQGIQHYMAIDYFGGESKFILQKQHDVIKKQYCEDNNITFIAVPYFEMQNINQYLNERIIV